MWLNQAAGKCRATFEGWNDYARCRRGVGGRCAKDVRNGVDSSLVEYVIIILSKLLPIFYWLEFRLLKTSLSN